MPSPSPSRSVKIDQDERGGWSSDRPRREGAPARPADVGVRCHVLAPTDRLRYTPGSLLVIVCAAKAERDRFAQRVLEDRAALLSLDRVRTLLTGRVGAEELDARAGELLEAAVAKRIEAGESVVIAADGVDADERERYVRVAARLRRPRHLVLVETGREQVQDHDRAALNDLRRALDAGQLGAEGFHTALRLGGASVGELKRIVFRPAPAED